MLHSFFLPNLRMKQDVVPGMEQYMWFKATETGEFDIVCAELCGWGHYKMKGRVTFEPRERIRRLAGAEIRPSSKRDRVAQRAEARIASARLRPPTFDLRPSQHMSTITADTHAHSHGEHAHVGSFLSTYVFSRDHKIIGIQFLFSTLLWFFVGGLLALGVRWQLAWPWTDMPILGQDAVLGRRAARSRPSSTRCCSPCTPR